MLQRPGDHMAVWHFWDGAARDFVCWYLNIQTAFVRCADGYLTQDLDRLDAGGPWWDTSWSSWHPPVGWVAPTFPA
jgi:hypothetical protein